MTTIFESSYVLQNNIVNYAIIFSYIFYLGALAGITILSPEKINKLNEYAKIYIALFLIIRFNPFVNNIFSKLDKKIIYNAGIFLLATTALGKLVQEYIINKINNDILFSNIQ